ncbi:hypothetical protein GDI22_03575 [Salmonella enterica subsp. enterica]|nr:hypothetical protein [Salmonella enterica subsp. enterica serovar Kottbus]
MCGGWRKPAILTAAPFRGLPQPEAHCHSGFKTTALIAFLRNALSCCVIILIIRLLLSDLSIYLLVPHYLKLWCRMLIRVRRTTSRSGVKVSIFLTQTLNGG